MKKNEQNTKAEESGNRLNFYTCKMPKSRTAKYCLGCYEGSVFIDFNQQPRRRASGYVVLIKWLQSGLIPFVTT